MRYLKKTRFQNLTTLKTALTTQRELLGTSWVTEGMCPIPEIYCAARGPLQGDIDTQGIEMPPLNSNAKEELALFYEEKYGIKLPPPPLDYRNNNMIN